MKIHAFLILLFTSPLWAAEKPPLIQKNIEISEDIDNIAQSLDMYLAGKKYKGESNKTKIILRNRVDWTELTKEAAYSLDLDAQLHLPNLEEKWALRFTSYDANKEERGINKNRIPRGEREEQYGAALVFASKLADFDVEFQPKLHFDNGFKFSYILGFESEAESESMDITNNIELLAQYDRGTGIYYSLGMNFDLSKTWLLGISNDFEYSDQDSLFSSNNGLFFQQILSRKSDLRYGTIYESDNSEVNFRLQQYSYYISYSAQVYKNVAHIIFTPRLVYPRAQNFSQVVGAQLGIDLIF